MVGTLHIQGLSLPFSALSSFSRPLSSESLDVIDFCKKWLEGENSFTLTTSGSTGEPKPIHLTRAQMEASAQATIQRFGLQAGDKALVGIPTRYIGGKMMLVRAMMAQMDAYVVTPSSNPLRGLSSPIDFVALVPLQMQTILEGNHPDDIQLLEAMNAIIIGGGGISPALRALLQSLKVPVYNTYGMTETVSHIALMRLNGPQQTENFRVLPGITIDSDHRGCLKIKGAVTQHTWIVTNDLVSMTSADTFEWLGRADHVVNTGGVKIHVEPLEKNIHRLIRAMGLEHRFFVAGLPDSKLGERIVLCLEGEPLDVEREKTLLKGIEKEEGKYATPKEIRYTHQFVETETGKIIRTKSLELSILKH
jgi:o-succinylbenzoate---CoA ligase